jgi:hypothetical protein
MMLQTDNIVFHMVNGEAQIMLGNFEIQLFDNYIRKDQRNHTLDNYNILFLIIIHFQKSEMCIVIILHTHICYRVYG